MTAEEFSKIKHELEGTNILDSAIHHMLTDVQY